MLLYYYQTLLNMIQAEYKEEEQNFTKCVTEGKIQHRTHL